jgi:hypothetical protein
MYAIKSWNDIFENNRSRTFDEPKYVNWPVRRDSEGFASLMRDAKGMAAFGVFGALVQWIGRQPVRNRRHGVLADDKGPMTPERFAVRMGAPIRDVRAAWDRLVSIGWLVTVTAASLDCHQTDTEVTPDCHPTDTVLTPKCYGAERSGKDRSGEERSGGQNDAGGVGGGSPESHSLGHPPARPPKPPPAAVEAVRDARSVRDALAALHIDGKALGDLAASETLTLDVLRETVAEIVNRPGVRNPKRLLVSVLCERHGVKIEKGAKYRIGSEVNGVVAQFEAVRRSKMGGGA